MNYEGPEFEDEEGDEGPWRPHGMRPHGMRPHGMRPHGMRPHGMRPHGMRPHGMRPHGMRPHGMRPHGMRPNWETAGGGGLLDPEEWSADIAELICERSALIRLGATLISTDAELWVPAFNANVGFRAPGASAPAPGGAVVESLLPTWRLEAAVAVPTRLVRGIAESPELTYTLKIDLAEALARGADEACLWGALPGAIRPRAALRVPVANPADLLAAARGVVAAVRRRALVRNPGWILHPEALNVLTTLLTGDGLTGVPLGTPGARSLDSHLGLFSLDGDDRGTLLGYPFVTSIAAGPGVMGTIYFAANWQEAWIGVDPSFVTVAVPGEPGAPGETVIRASMPFDFALRRAAAFAWA